tara:strand:+ start:524495 stop:525634 length:1140 start_codon:yes stop_codon:yes gene_type:complete
MLLKFKMRKYILHIILLIGVAGYAQNDAKVSTKVDTTKIRIGEKINYQIVVDNAANGVIFPELELDSLGGVEIVESFNVDTLKNRLIKKYALTSFDSGSYVIPRQRVLIWSQEYLTDSLRIDVATVAVDTTKQQMYTIKAIQNEPYTLADYKKYLWWLLLVFMLVGLVAYFILRKKPTEEEIEARIPPYQLALKRLTELDEKQLWQNNKIKEYYVELTGIVRTYIEREIRIPALESTTDELVETLNDFKEVASIETSDDTLKKLKELLQEADLVKFAKSAPLANEIEADRQDAEVIINTLKPAANINAMPEIESIRKVVLVQKPSYTMPSSIAKILIILGLLLIGFLIVYGISSTAKSVGNINNAVQQHSVKTDAQHVE